MLAGANPPSKRELASTPGKPIPRALLDRPKTGSSVPVREWFQQKSGTEDASDPSYRGWVRFDYDRWQTVAGTYAAGTAPLLNS
jgi:hypothetical protein